MSIARYVAVVGPGDADDATCATAYEVGRLLGARPHVAVVCGGLGGVMAAAARGAADAGGISVGILPGRDRSGANPYLTVSLPTGLGELRDGLVAACADAVIAVGGSWGTTAEIALAAKHGTPVISLGGWRISDEAGEPIDGVRVATSPGEAVGLALTAYSVP